MTLPSLPIVTTSWDDGDTRDLKLAELLRERGISATFYVPLKPYSSHAALSDTDLRNLADQGFEIGAHGISHENLTQIPSASVAQVVSASKQGLQDILGQEVKMFCYPGGWHNATAVQSLKAAGYFGARTTRMLSTEPDFAAFEMPTSLQAYPHGHAAYFKNASRARSFRRVRDYLVHLRRAADWVALGQMLFDRVMAQGGIWHLYGHSWEIDQLALWNDLGKLLQYVSGRAGVLYLSNGDILRRLRAERQAGLER